MSKSQNNIISQYISTSNTACNCMQKNIKLFHETSTKGMNQLLDNLNCGRNQLLRMSYCQKTTQQTNYSWKGILSGLINLSHSIWNIQEMDETNRFTDWSNPWQKLSRGLFSTNRLIAIHFTDVLFLNEMLLMIFLVFNTGFSSN